MIMRFKCGCCGEIVKKEPRVPEGFAGLAYSCGECGMEWLESGEEIPPLDKQVGWLRREKRPEVGESAFIYVHKPFDEEIGNEFYMQLTSPRDYYSEEMTDEVIACGGIIKCRFESVVSHNEYEAWIKVKVLEVFMNNELHKAFDEYVSQEPLITEFISEEKYTEKWKHINIWEGQGDLGEYCEIFTGSDGREHLVLQKYWDFHNNYVYFGNKVEKIQNNDKKDNR